MANNQFDLFIPILVQFRLNFFYCLLSYEFEHILGSLKEHNYKKLNDEYETKSQSNYSGSMPIKKKRELS